MTGIHPTLESVIAQFVLLSIYLIGLIYIHILKPWRYWFFHQYQEASEAKFFLFLSFDVGTDVKDIIETELLPYIDKNRELSNSYSMH